MAPTTRATAARARHYNRFEYVTPIEYVPLAEDNSELRILHILPGGPADTMLIQLTTISFDAKAEDKLPYEALSYTWGSPVDPVKIFIAGEHGLRSLAVTQNCHEALQNLRHPDKARTVWVDAICINQKDLRERARQVSIMRSVYGKAARVFVWLGLRADNSDRALQWINTMSPRLAHDKSDPTTADPRGNWSLMTPDPSVTSDMELEAFTALLERSYFDRLWVWQEVRMGGDDTIVKCGNYETTFKALITIVHYLVATLTAETSTTMRLYPRLIMITKLPVSGFPDSLLALNHLRECQCTDQRDRIYTAPAFGHFNKVLRMTPDYECSTQDVYIDFILKYLKVCENLRFLDYIGNDVVPDESYRTLDMPSWIPDWSQKNITPAFPNGICSGRSAVSLVSANRVQLCVQGIKVDTVDKVAPFGDESFALSVYRGTCRTLQSLLPHGVDDEQHHRLARILTGSLYAEHYVPSIERYPTMEQCSRYLRQALGQRDLSSLDPKVTDDTLIQGKELVYAQSHFGLCQGRSLFTTTDGEVGLGTQHMCKGDMLVILLGCRSATILRPSEIHHDCFRVVGTAFCTHIMDSEPLLGHLPEDFESILALSESDGSYTPAFRNKSDGSVTYQDPRLPPLSSEWETLTWKETQAYFIGQGPPLAYRNKSIQETLDYRKDPRMTADALKERGVNIETFQLV